MNNIIIPKLEVFDYNTQEFIKDNFKVFLSKIQTFKNILDLSIEESEFEYILNVKISTIDNKEFPLIPFHETKYPSNYLYYDYILVSKEVIGNITLLKFKTYFKKSNELRIQKCSCDSIDYIPFGDLSNHKNKNSIVEQIGLFKSWNDILISPNGIIKSYSVSKPNGGKVLLNSLVEYYKDLAGFEKINIFQKNKFLKTI